MNLKKYLILTIITLFSFKSFAHPVIYKGGWVLWGSYAPDMNTQRVSYTFNPKFSMEVNSTWFQNHNNYRDYTVGINYLFKRWLNEDSQGNLYGAIHSGYYKDDVSDGNVNHIMLMGDWESRSLYTAGSVMSYLYDGNDYYKYSYRIGFAPYVAGMNTLQTWMILKLDYFKENNRNLVPTPMIRFFYKNVLWEAGASTQGDFFLTLMTHY